jgi:hypothetical protein
MICLLTLYFCAVSRQPQAEATAAPAAEKEEEEPPSTTTTPRRRSFAQQRQRLEEAQQWFSASLSSAIPQFITLLFYSNNAFYGEQLTRRPCFATFQGYFERASLRVIRKTT